MAENDGGVIFRGGVAFIDDVVDRPLDGVKLEDVMPPAVVTDAAVAAQVSAGPSTQSALDASYAKRRQQLLVAAATGLRPLSVANPAVHPAPPTVDFTQTGSSAIAGSHLNVRPTSEQGISNIGIVPRWNATNFAMESYSNSRGSGGLEIEVFADVVEMFFRAGASGGRYWVWVDDLPLTALPVVWSGSTAAAQRLTLTFLGVEQHRILVFADLLELQQVRVGGGHSINASPRRPIKFMTVGDSLTEGSGEATTQVTWPSTVARLLGWEQVMNALGGTGYASGAKPFTYVDRLTAMSDETIDFYHFKGSVNDAAQSAATVQAAAELCFQTIYDNNPRAVILVSGPDPTNDSDALGATQRANSDAVRAAALAWADRNVIGWVDPLMTRGASVWVSGAAYAVGDRVTYQGGVYECVKATTTSGFNANDFARVSPLYGTGRIGATASNGNRDTFLLSDDVHWSLAAHRYFGQFFADHYVRALAAFARGEFYLHE